MAEDVIQDEEKLKINIEIDMGESRTIDIDKSNWKYCILNDLEVILSSSDGKVDNRQGV